MATNMYLAMTGAEFASAEELPPKIGWMACHFSPYGKGLSNLPVCLPPGSLLILNDRIPICGHDPQRIAEQLQQSAATLNCSGILLDFQKPDTRELKQLSIYLADVLPCPVAVSDGYADGLSCPVFLSPCPHHVHLQEHIAPWKERELWLDLAVNAESITLTAAGSGILPLPLGEIPDGAHSDERLHCHYSIENTDHSSCFTLWRTAEDLKALAKEAEGLGIRTFVGLYQEMGMLF